MEGAYRWKGRSDEVAHIVWRKCVTTALTASVDCGARATTTHGDRLIALTGNHEWQPRYASDTDLLDGDRISRISLKRAQGSCVPDNVPVTLSLSRTDRR